MAGGRIEIEVVPNLDRFPGLLNSGLKSSNGLASNLGRGLGLAIAGGTTVAAIGLKNVIDLGVEYQDNLNQLQAVTRATGEEMARVGDVAKELGSDITLPGTSAADAAAAMKELAKGGLDVNEAMTAAKGTLQLAAAAQVEAAQAAEIQSDALNQFGLAATDAGHVADVLANTANAASGEITDVANALKYVGPVAKTVGVDIDNVATAIGLVATQGIRGEQAGTSLRGMLASLSAPSKPAAAALKDLGIEAFTAEGKFVGLRAITEQLAAAKGRLTEATFIEATATAFGNEGMTIASALASTGAKAFDDMAASVSRAGGAADVAAAKTQGLGGAWEGLVSQAETTGIEIFEVIDGPLERLVRAGAQQLDNLNDEIVSGLERVISAAEVYGPRLGEALGDRVAVAGRAVEQVLGPLAEGSVKPLNEAVNTGIGLWDNLTGALDNAVSAATPLAESVGDLASSSAEGTGATNALASGVGLVGDAFEATSAILVPVGELLGLAVDGFTALPGPVQTAVAALVAFRIARSALGDTAAFSSLRQFSGEMRVQQALAQANGESMSRLGSITAAYRTSTIGAVAATRDFADQTAAVRAGAAATGQPIGLMSAAMGTLAERSSALGAVRASFQNAAEGATRFGTAAGVAAASGTTLKLAAGGLVGALGGPVGVVIAGAAVGLSILAGRQQEAAAQTAAHEGRVKNLVSALRESNGVITESVRVQQAQDIQTTKVGESQRDLTEVARDLGVGLTDITDATLGNVTALESLRTNLRSVAEANREFATLEDGSEAWTGRYNERGQAAVDLLGSIEGLTSGVQEAQRRERELDEAIKAGTASMVAGTTAGRGFGSAMDILGRNTATADDRARALKDALDALSGGTVNLEAAQVRMYGTLDRLKELFGETLDRTQGWGNALNNAQAPLINADGSINSLTKNGRNLSETLRDLKDRTTDTATATYDMAIAQGDSVPVAAAKAQAAAQGMRDTFTGLTKETGLSADELALLADRAGLIPDNIAIALSTPGDDKVRAELLLIKGLVEQVPPGKDIHMKTISAEAERKLNELGFQVQHMPDGTVTIKSNTDPARQGLDSWLREPATKVVNIAYRDPGAPVGPRLGQPNLVNHDGNYLLPMAAGGLTKLNPMRGGVASIVPPNTWRVIGDRMVDPEAYIPINKSARSQRILMQTAQDMGYDLIRRFATGGVAYRTAEALSANASATEALQLSLSSNASGATFPSTVTLVDANGSILGQMRVVAEQALNATAREVQLRRGRP